MIYARPYLICQTFICLDLSLTKNYRTMRNSSMSPPFRFWSNEKMNCVSPIKFYEYLALGKPVVSSAMDRIDASYAATQYSFVECANGADEFLFYVRKHDARRRSKKDAEENGPIIAKDLNSWTSRVEQIEPILLNQNTSILETAYTKTDVIVLVDH